MDAQRQVQEYVLFEPTATYLTSRGEFLSAAQQAARHLVQATGRAWRLGSDRSGRVDLRLPGEGLRLPADFVEVEDTLSVQPGQITFVVPTSAPDDTELIHLFTLPTRQLDDLLLRRAG